MKNPKIPFPNLIIFALAGLAFFSCNKEKITVAELNTEAVSMPSSQADEFLSIADISQRLDGEFFNQANIINTDKSCDTAIDDIVDLLQPFANKHCKAFYFCILCVLDGAQVYMYGIVQPKGCLKEEVEKIQPLDKKLLKTLDPALQSSIYNINSNSPDSKDLPTLSVAIQVNPCVYGGEALTAYNPYNWDTFEDQSLYQVLWYKNGILFSKKFAIECICGGNYSVIVLNRKTYKAVGIAFYSSPCEADDQ